jgi:hypothetical protein
MQAFEKFVKGTNLIKFQCKSMQMMTQRGQFKNVDVWVEKKLC